MCIGLLMCCGCMQLVDFPKPTMVVSHDKEGFAFAFLKGDSRSFPWQAGRWMWDELFSLTGCALPAYLARSN